MGPNADGGQTGGTGGGGQAGKGVTITWCGHAAFLITSPGGVRVLTDPYAGNLGYGDRRFEADLVTVSHEHVDHNSVASVEGDPEVLRGLAGGDWATVAKTVGDVTVSSIPGTYHDASKGAKRGKNGLFLIETGGLRLLHLGDLGDVPTQDVVNRAGRVDVLMIPVGGLFTVDAETATRIADMFGAKVIIPMHYRTAAIADWQIADVAPFVRGKSGVKEIRDGQATLTAEELPGTPEVWVFDLAPEGAQ